MDYETKKDEENLKQYQQKLTALGFQVNLQIGFGKPSSEIVRIVTELDMDLLVMGAHGHKGLKDLIFGTTLDAVRHKIKIPIFIIN